MAKLEIKGLDKLEKALKKNVAMDDVKRIVRKNGAALQTNMQRRADFDRGYQTGTTKRNIGLELKDDGLTAVSGPETEYSPYVEYGTRFMDAQPFVRPAFDGQKEKFKADMKKLVR